MFGGGLYYIANSRGVSINVLTILILLSFINNCGLNTF